MKCGKKDMTFSCRYCGEEYCTDHRLPENHGCDMDAAEDSGSEDKWFDDSESTAADRETKRGTAFLKRLKRSYRSFFPSGISPTMAIIGVTTAVFALQLLTGFQRGSVWEQFVLPSNLSVLATRPWAFITANFLHNGVLHWFANMITFYFFGSALERMLSVKEFIAMYFVSGFASMLAFVAFQNILFQVAGSPLGSAVGASGAVVAMFAAVATINPDAEMLLYFFIPMKLKTGLRAFAAIELFNMLMKVNGVFLPFIGGLASSAHLMGIAVGILVGRKIRSRARSSYLPRGMGV